MDQRTTEILKRFSESWEVTEKRYNDLIDNYPGFEDLKPLRQFISKLRQEGEEKYFRAGTSMFTFILSRSIDFGLRIDQKHIKIEVINLNDFEITFQDGEKIYRKYRIVSLDDNRLTKLIQTLKHTLVD